jgi:hypothetical protein
MADLALLARLMREGELARASLSTGERRTARRLVEPTLAMRRDQLMVPLVVYRLDPEATCTLADPELLAAVLARLPQFLAEVECRSARAGL